MAIRPNRYYGGVSSGYNDPAMSETANNISKLFAAPTGAEMYAAAHARSENAKAGRLAQLFLEAADPNVNATTFANRAGIAGAFNPNQSLEAVDRNNRTTLATNSADNARALQQTTMQQAGENTRAATAPLSEGQTRAPGLGRFYGTPDMPENTQGVVKLNEGQVATGPGGFSAAGTPKPLTEADVKGAILGGLPANDQRAVAMQGVPVETIQGPDGARIVNRQDAVGQAPQGPDVSGQVQNYGTANGHKGIAVPNRDGQMRDAQTGALLPPEAQIFRSQAAGTPDQLGGKTTEAQDRFGLALKLTENPTKIINDAYASGRLPTQGDDVIRAISNIAPDAVGPMISQQMSPDAQRFHQAIKDAVPYQLLALSGQGVTEPEYNRTMARLIPFANDTDDVKQQKLAQFNAFRQAIQGLAGGAAAKVGAVPTAPGVAVGSGAQPAPGQTTMPPLGAPVDPAQQGQQAAAAGVTPVQPQQPGPAAAPQPAPTGPQPPPQAVQHLKANPALASAFDAKFGPGASAAVLGGR